MKISIEFRAFESKPRIVELDRSCSIEKEDEPAILEDLFRAFNHATEQTGELARKFKTRSLSVGDRIFLGNKGFQCMSVGWKEVGELKWTDLNFENDPIAKLIERNISESYEETLS